MIAIPPRASELETTLQQAVLHHRSGRLVEAEKLYRGILRVKPEEAGIHNALGIALKDQGRLEEAAAAFQEAVTAMPDYAPGHSNLGNILFTKGKLAEAEQAYRRALALKPDMA